MSNVAVAVAIVIVIAWIVRRMYSRPSAPMLGNVIVSMGGKWSLEEKLSGEKESITGL